MNTEDVYHLQFPGTKFKRLSRPPITLIGKIFSEKNKVSFFYFLGYQELLHQATPTSKTTLTISYPRLGKTRDCIV